MASDPGYAEAKELLEIVLASGSQKTPSITSISDRLRAGAEALTRGWKSSAIQNWARGLSADPSNRIFQLLVLLTTTPSPKRRSRYLQELLGISKDLLDGDRSEEAHALLLALQAIEDPEDVSPQLSGAPETLETSSSTSSDPTTRRRLKPTDTQPTAFTPGPHEDTYSWSDNGIRPGGIRPGTIDVSFRTSNVPRLPTLLMTASMARIRREKRHWSRPAEPNGKQPKKKSHLPRAPR